MKKIGIWIALILVALWVINAPGDAAALINKVGNALQTLSTALS